MPKVSVIVPVYNAEKTLTRCLDSIVGQTYKDMEIILVNDGSSDSSRTICEKYCSEHIFFRLINQINLGPGTARNTGIDNVKGKYISFIDADDYVESTMIEEMVNVAEKNQAEMVICNYYQEFAGKVREHKYKYESGLYEGESVRKIAIELISDVSDTRIPPYSWVRMILRDVLKNPKIRYAPGIVRSEDYYLYVQVHFRINRLYLLTDKHLYHYMEVGESVTHSYVKNYWELVKEIYLGLQQCLPKEREIEERLNTMLLQRCLVALNNSSRCDNKGFFKKEVHEITRDKLLNSVIRNMEAKEGISRFGIFYMLILIHAYFVVYWRYMIKYHRRKR